MAAWLLGSQVLESCVPPSILRAGPRREHGVKARWQGMRDATKGLHLAAAMQCRWQPRQSAGACAREGKRKREREREREPSNRALLLSSLHPPLSPSSQLAEATRRPKCSRPLRPSTARKRLHCSAQAWQSGEELRFLGKEEEKRISFSSLLSSEKSSSSFLLLFSFLAFFMLCCHL